MLIKLVPRYDAIATKNISGQVSPSSTLRKLVRKTLVGAIGLSATLSAQIQEYSPVDSPSTTVYNPAPNFGVATLPETFDTRYNPGGVAVDFTNSPNQTVTMTDSGNVNTNRTNLQNEINSATSRSGNTKIRLPNGWIHEGRIFIPNNPNGNFWLYIEWVNLATASSEGVRCNTSNMSNAPIFRANAINECCLTMRSGAHHFRVSGVKFEVKSGVAEMYGGMIQFWGVNANGDVSISTTNDYCDWVIADRIWIQGLDDTVQDGIRLHGKHCAIIDSVIRNIWASGVESHAIMTYDGVGPFKIVNCEGVGDGMCIMQGGANPSINGIIPTGFEIRRNWFYKPLSWNNDPSKVNKNAWEVKFANEILFEGNIVENITGSGQNGFCINIQRQDHIGGPAWATTLDYTIRYNLVRDCVIAFTILGATGEPNSQPKTSRVEITDNLVYRVGLGGGGGRCFLVGGGGVVSLYVRHVTAAFRAQYIDASENNTTGWYFASGGHTNLYFNDNCIEHGHYGYSADGGGTITTVFNNNASGYTWVRNHIPKNNGQTATAPTTTIQPNSRADLWVDPANFDFNIKAAYQNDASDGKNPGADLTLVSTATSGVATGSP